MHTWHTRSFTARMEGMHRGSVSLPSQLQIVYMGEIDTERQKLNCFRLSAAVGSADGGRVSPDKMFPCGPTAIQQVCLDPPKHHHISQHGDVILPQQAYIDP